MTSYSKPSISNWQCREDAQYGEYFCHNISLCNLEITQPFKLSQYVLLGFACDLGVMANHGRAGANMAPNIIRQFLSKLAIPAIIPILDCGNVNAINNLVNAQQTLATYTSQLKNNNIIPIILGGGHETAFGHWQGLIANKSLPNLAIVNFDAHFDLRALINGNDGSSGTPFRQIYEQSMKLGLDFNYYCLGIQKNANTQELFSFAKHTNTQYLLAETMLNQKDSMISMLNTIIQNHEHIYVTICLDVLHANYAPGVSAPQPLGINPWLIIEALRILKKSNKVISLDFVELNPNFDQDNITARLCANFIYEYIYS